MSAVLRTLKREWGWTGVDFATVLMVSRMGHLVVADADGTVHYLDTDTRELLRLGTEAQAEQYLADPEVQLVWRAEALVAAVRERLGATAPDEVYARTAEAMLNDTYDIQSFIKLPLTQLISFTGQVAHQMRDMPEGTPVKLKAVLPS
ncbi:hypothetical protein [Novosphingobium sp. 9]|uniref:hypothetical protein n=1 Tax=Novosphingobium sp. 9 TaxID=2025349 RepID=UPI0021B4F872|nr:hypothetical protein [Novosphingobium sp. 9]